MKTLFIVLVLIVLLAMAAVVFVNRCGGGDGTLEGAWSSIYSLITGEGSTSVIESNEMAVKHALQQYVTAQKAFKADNGTFSNKLSMLDIPDAFARARMETLGARAYNGYKFVHVPKNGKSVMFYRDEFVLCAVPALYKVSGINTYAIGPNGIVIYKDNEGAPVMNAADLADSTWITE